MADLVRYFGTATGRVQGVGFRMFVQQNALELGITGWVKNMDDGTVTMEVQGYPAQVDELRRLLREDSYIEIAETEMKEIPIDPDERSFGVRY